MKNEDDSISEIQQFFRGTNIFITGVTGFLGRILVEKLLRSCMVNKVYLLIRPKKNKDPQTRLRELLNTSLFKRLWKEQPDFIDKIYLIVGDCIEPNLGLAPADEEFIIANIDIVVHSAATITINGPLKRATFINVRSTRDLLLIAQRMHRLKSFVHVSTAFSNPNQPLIEEIVYKCHLDGNTLINMAENLSDSFFESITSKCLGTWPNTYTLSKCIAENLVQEYGKNIPICITRPCVVSFTGEEPMSGWATINDTTPGLCLAVGLGAVRVLYMSYDTPAVFAPADKVSNMVITSAWHASKTRSNSSIPVYNYVPNNMAPPLTYGQTFDSIANIVSETKKYSSKAVWIPSVKLTSSNTLYTILFFLYHYLPAFFTDCYMHFSGKKLRVTKIYKRVDSMMRDMKIFGTNNYVFDDQNVKTLISLQSKQDKKLFNMDLSDIVWKDYFFNCLEGIKKYILNDPENDLEGHKRHQMIVVAYYVLHSTLYGLLFYLIYSLSKIFI